MEAVRHELKRLARGIARRGGAARAARWHLVLLVAAVVAAFLSRAWRPLPGLARLEGAVLPVLLAALGLYALGTVLAFVWTRFLRPPERSLARALDERYAWHDETTTALALEPPAGETPLAGLLVAQTEGRLRELDARALASSGSLWVLPRRLLAFLFAFVLLAPGVEGLLGPHGAGTQGQDGLGQEGATDEVAVPRPMRADFWLQTFIENPLPVEPLPPEGGAAPPGAADPDKDAPDEGAGGGR